MYLDPNKLTPAGFHILLSLSESPRHGYEIMQDIAHTTEGQFRLGPGTLYSTIKRLLQDQLIKESTERPPHDQDDERRRYYELTLSGKQALHAEVTRLNNLVKTAKKRGVALA